MPPVGNPRCVFVYGTLRRNEHNHRLLRGLPLLDFYQTAPRYTLINLGLYPGTVMGGNTAIVGELYPLRTGLLVRLDRLENYPYEYTRKLIPTPHGPAWIYIYRRRVPGAPVITSGDWRHRRSFSSRQFA